MGLTAIEGRFGRRGGHKGGSDGGVGRAGRPGGLQLAALLCADLFSVSLSEIYGSKRGAARIALARQAAAYLAHVTFGLTYEAVGRALGRDRTTVAHACRRIEDLRDEPAFDRMIGEVEAELTRLSREPSHLRLCAAAPAQAAGQ